MKAGEIIRQARKAKGWTQGELAARVPISRPRVSEWERGFGEPDLAQAEALARLLEVPLERLLEALGARLYPASEARQIPRELIDRLLAMSDEQVNVFLQLARQIEGLAGESREEPARRRQVRSRG